MKNKTKLQAELDEKIGAWMRWFDLDWTILADWYEMRLHADRIAKLSPNIHILLNLYNQNDEWGWSEGAETLQQNINLLLNWYGHHLMKRMSKETALYYQMNFLKMKAEEIQQAFYTIGKKEKSP